MLEVYSVDISVLANQAVPFNTVRKLPNCKTGIVRGGLTDIELTRPGVYQIDVTANVVAAAAGLASIQLSVNGELQPQAISSVTAADATSVHPLSFSTTVAVGNNNRGCPCQSTADILQIMTGEVGLTIDMIDWRVIRL